MYGSDLSHLARNAATLAAAEAAARLANAVFVILAVRRLGAGDYGLYATALTVLLFARLVSRLGLQGVVVVRDVAERKELAGRYFSSAVLLALPPSLALWLVLPWAARLVGYPEELARLLAVAGAALVGQAVARPAEDLLRAFERMRLYGAASIALSVATAAAGIALLALGFGIGALVWLQVASAWVEAALLLVLVQRQVARLAWEPSRDVIRRLAGEGAVLALLIACDFVVTRIDVLILARLVGAEAVGHYVPAVRILEYAAIFRSGAGGALFPFLAARWQGSARSLGHAYRQAQRVYVLYAIGCAVGLSAGAEPIVRLLFGPAYRGTAVVLVILAWAMAVDLCAGPYAEVILVHRRSLLRFVPATGGLALLSAALNLGLAPRWGPVGAALAVLATTVVSLAVRLAWLGRVLAGDLPAPAVALLAVLWRPLLAGLGMAGAFAVLARLGFWAALGPATLVYAALLIVSGAVRRQELAAAVTAAAGVLTRNRG